MRRALLALLGLAGFSHAFFGDWKIWSPVQTARNAVLRYDQTILAATTGGVVSWDPIQGKGMVYTGQQGVPSLDVAAVVADSSNGIWAVCTDGHIAYLPPYSSTWTPVPSSYPGSGWTFSPGAAVFWKGYLVLGGPKGLSLFDVNPNDTANYLTAVDNITAFGAVHDTVVSVFARNDTIWASLPEGLAFTTDTLWKGDSISPYIGRAGHYLTADRWTTSLLPVRNAYTLLSDSTGVRLGLPQQWSDYAQGVSISGGTITWKNGSAIVPGANQALSTPWGYFVSTTGQGLELLTQAGVQTPLHPDGALPSPVPHSVGMGSDGTPFYSLGGTPAAQLWIGQPSGGWVADTIKVKLPDSSGNMVTTSPVWDENETIGRHRHELSIGPKGERIVIAFGGGPWPGGVRGSGVLVSTTPGNWISRGKDQDTCLVYLPTGVPPSFGVATISARSDSTGTWISEIGQANPTPRIQFLPAGGASAPDCLELHEADLGAQGDFNVNDFASAGNALWLATSLGLVRVPNPTPAYPPVVAKGISSWPDPSSAPQLLRLTKMSLGQSTWIVAAGAATLGAHSLGGAKTDTFFTAHGIDQTYTALAVDALGQLWAAGNLGIDIYDVSLDENNHPSFQRTRRVTHLDGLPDDNVLDLQLDPTTGKALIATSSALSLWTSPYREVPVRLAKSAVKVWPNPLRLRQTQTLFVDGATAGADFDLLAADGTLIVHKGYSLSTNGLFKIQLPTNTSKLRPGVYYWSLKDGQSSLHGPLLIGE